MGVIFTASMNADFSEWTTESDADGDLNWSAAAGLAGSAGGMAALIDDNNPMYCSKTLTTSTTGIMRARLYVNPNTISMADGNQYYFFGPYNSAVGRVGHINMRYNGASYQIVVGLVNDALSDASATAVNISNAEHYVEYMLTRASSDVASDGRVDWWIDGVAQAAVTTQDNWDRFNNLGSVRMGPYSGIDTSTRGTVYFDELVVRDDNVEIGPLALGQPAGARGIFIPGMRQWQPQRVGR